MPHAHDLHPTELDQALDDERAVNAQAWALGFYSVPPISPLRIQELCRLGDEMIAASLRRQDAADRASGARLQGQAHALPTDGHPGTGPPGESTSLAQFKQLDRLARSAEDLIAKVRADERAGICNAPGADLIEFTLQIRKTANQMSRKLLG